MPLQRMITFTTDFGVTEHYVGVMKGVIYSIHPTAQIADITNGVQSFDLLDGALAISQAYSYFPKNTVHMVIVDPGVGGSRRPILASMGDHLFVAPDNGVLSLVYEHEERVSVRHITAEHYFHQPVSSTFHGRDIFSPVAAHLSKGVEPDRFGDEIEDFVRFLTPKPKASGDRSWKAVVLKKDKFGNLMTNITPNDIPELFALPTPAFKITVGKMEVTKLLSSYVHGAPSEIFAVLGSAGFLEISANRTSAARTAGADKGSEVSVVLG